MAKAIHSMIRVLDAARSLEFYNTAFALTPAGRLEFESFSLIYLRNAESSFELELTVNHGHTQAYALGDGYGHLAVSVEDLAATHARLIDAGLQPTPLRTLELAGQPVAKFCFLRDPDGYQIEILERGGRFQ